VFGPPRLRSPVYAEEMEEDTMQATKDMLIMQVIELDEGTADILMGAGMHCLGCAMAHGESIEDACAVHGIDPDALIDELNKYLATK
jgi:hybrid cluster-associated redox disulfide protein